MTNSDAPKRIRKRGTRKNKAIQKEKPAQTHFLANRLSFILTALLSLCIAGLLALAWFTHDLPDINTLTQVTKTPSIIIRTEKGDIVGSSGDIYGEYIRYNDIPRDLIKALIATEDRNFFTHGGIDPFGLLRAAFANFRAGRIVQGGSTITQQLAKNVFLTPERSLKRKLQEVILALKLEHKYTKQQIITVYLNRVYFGAGTYGIDAAARRYFGKPAKKLYLPESAMLAGLLKAPSRYSPVNSKDLAIGRAKQVLLNMVDAGLLNEGQMKAAASMYSSLSFPKFASTNSRRYFTDWILEQIPDYVGNIDRDLIVTTTFNPSLQATAETALTRVMNARTTLAKHAGEAALISMAPDGAVLAMLGGKDYGKSQYNRAVQAERQPGSSFKLFVYLAALEAGWHPYSLVEDAPVSVGNWNPDNYDNQYRGQMFMREAFEHSINSVAVRLSESVGRSHVIEMAHRLGIKESLENYPSIALGVTETTLMEMTTAYAHLAAEGRTVLPYGIISIKDTYNHVFYQRTGSQAGWALKHDTVAQMNDMLMAVVESGTGKAANIGRPIAGKTGTSQNFKDAWFIGFVPQLVTGVWVGNDDNRPMRHITGGTLPAQIWHDYMQIVLKDEETYEIPRDAAVGYHTSPDHPEAQENATSTQKNPHVAPSHKNGGVLSPSFWDKLLSSGGNHDGSEASIDPRRRTDRIRR